MNLLKKIASKYRRQLSLIATLFVVTLAAEEVLANTKICRYTSGARKNDIVAVTGSTRCPSGTRGVTTIRDIYGNGGSGALTVSSDTTADRIDAQYSNITIAAGRTLSVASGSILRCSGNFTNNGTIGVIGGSSGGNRMLPETSTIMPTFSQPHPGNGPRAASMGAIVESASASAAGGRGGSIAGLSQGAVRVNPGPFGGGGGAPGAYEAIQSTKNGGSGGGSLLIICGGTIVNNGVIQATGGDASDYGGGGGGGGIVVLAAGSQINNTSSIYVNGGTGASSEIDAETFAVAPGGGGGGGYIHLIAPNVTPNIDGLNIGGGQAGTLTSADASGIYIKVGGGAGGSCYGGGGGGGSIQGTTIGSAQIGESGTYTVTTVDPLAIFAQW